ncbi:uncharacterized protein LOC109708228 [Ananas comosus]|uniref:Uncharacterized protein LOC109708228 n=1 Tax=Ananas comosus TaxID=4615 RepID=A0A6P5EW51_ANACO|nr:uncharacterized protein LOC109708228 [Ananas comosus]
MISSNFAVAWYWVIETLADDKGFDTSVLKALMYLAPNFFADAPETVLERVALRYLEECVDEVRDCGGEISSPPRSPIDGSRSCEEVLCSHLRKMETSSNMEKDRFGTYIRGIHQFIIQKRASVPKLSLDLLKGSILEGKYPSLSECSGLIRHDQEDLLQSNIEGEHERVKRLRFSTRGNGMEISQKSASGSAQRLLNQYFSDSDKTDRLHKDIVGVEGNKIQSLERSDTLKPSGKENTNLDDDERHLSAQVPDALISSKCTQISVKDVSIPHNNSTALPNAHKNSTALPNPHNNSTDLPNLPLNECGEKLIPTCTENDQHHGNTIGIPVALSNDVLEDADFEPADEIVAAVKHHLLRSQAKNNQDSIVGDWTEQSLCIKCHNGGQLLTCSANGCSVAIHDSCLGSVEFDKAGLFYCPFCTYLRAKKNLSTFLGKGIGRRQTGQATVVKLLDDLSCHYPTGRLNGDSLRAEHHKKMEVTDFSRQAEKQVRVVRCDDSTSVAKINDEQIVDEAATTVEGTDTAFLNEQVENLQSTETHTAVDNGNLPCKNGNTSHGEHDAAVLQQKGETSTVNDHQNIQEPSSDEQVKDTFDDDTGNQVSPSQNSGRHHKKAQEADPETVENQKRFKSSPGKRRHAYQAKRYSNPLMPPGRRTKLPWTPEEEATLKEGMEIFAADGSGNIPWRKILDFGSHVFHKTRMPGDLKDKWRNIKIKEGIQK